jgi:hypothetical protein
MNRVNPGTVTVKVRATTADIRIRIRPPRHQLLKFGHGNAKLDDAVYTFSLPAGWSCPYARACLSKSNRQTGRIKDGPNTQFRCFAASNEARARSVRESRWHNFKLLQKCAGSADMAQLILASLSPYAGYVRIHVSGDFFSQDYFDSWMEVARQRLETVFYAYTKALPLWVAHLDLVGDGHSPGRLNNFVLTASYGGTYDELIELYGLRWARVVYSRQEADQLGLEIDHDDSHAMRFGPSFALLLHGTQPPGSEAAKALSALWAQGEFGHGEKADARRASRVPLSVLS